MAILKCYFVVLKCYRYAGFLRWISYEDGKVDFDNCFDVGRHRGTGEPTYLARANAKVSGNQGKIPAIYMPDLGFAITHYIDFVVFKDFELFCLVT